MQSSRERVGSDDPISLGILTDTSGPETRLLPELERVLVGGAPPFLGERDRVSLHVLDCSLVTSADDVQARPELLRQAMVMIRKSHDFIRFAGVTVPLPDAAVLSDPSTIPPNPSRKPVIGSRRILANPQ